MKKSKIAAICSLFALLLVGCNNNPETKPEGNKPGFDYEEPTTPEGDGEYQIAIDYSHKDTLNKLLADLSFSIDMDATKIFENMDANPLEADKGTVKINSLEKYDLNKDGNFDNDIGNFDKKHSFVFLRDNKTNEKTGIFGMNDKTVVQDGTSTKLDKKTFTDGAYTMELDTKNRKIKEHYDCKGHYDNVDTEMFMNEASLELKLQIINMDKIKKECLDLIRDGGGTFQNVEATDKYTFSYVDEFVVNQMTISNKATIEVTKEGFVNSISYETITREESIIVKQYTHNCLFEVRALP